MATKELKPCPFCGNRYVEYTNAKYEEDCRDFDECYKPYCNLIAVVCSVNKSGC